MTVQNRLRDDSLSDDLNLILAQTKDLWEDFRGERIFITGGTGFFGTWLLQSFIRASDMLGLGVSIVVLTRNPDEFRRKVPNIAADPSISIHAGDIRDFAFPTGEFSHIIHAAATSAVATFNNEDPLIKFDTVVQGTRRALDFAAACGARKFLYTSSGAVYGKQPAGMSHIPEDYPGAPNTMDLSSAWGESKRAAEFLCTYYSGNFGIDVKIARCFSFVGPFLPLDIHYAIGNFIRDGLRGGPILVRGDGTPRRSYMYASDLVIWLLTIFVNGKTCRAYNVGSEDDIAIADLAGAVSESFPKPSKVTIATALDPARPVDRYVPSTSRAREELGLKQLVDLRTSINKTISYHLAG